MYVRNNTTSPCCGKEMECWFSLNGASTEFASIDITCMWCRRERTGYVPILEIYRTIRKGSMLFPVDSPFINFGFWPVEGSVVRKSYSARVTHALDAIQLYHEGDHPIPLDNPYFGELARRILTDSFLAPSLEGLRRNH